jgi:hypothetical protein
LNAYESEAIKRQPKVTTSSSGWIVWVPSAIGSRPFGQEGRERVFIVWMPA